jgi:acyl carrier protein
MDITVELAQILKQRFEIENEDVQNCSLKELGLDSLDALDYLHVIKDKFIVKLDKSMEDRLMDLTISDLAPHLERLGA